MSDSIDEESVMYEQSSDPEVMRELENLENEEEVYELYWKLIKSCEELDLPLFNGLDSYYFGVWLRGEY
jgi:hypothetical protein